MDQEDPGIDFANDAEKRDASVVVADTSLTLVLVQGNDLGISHVLWHSSLSPALAEDFMQGGSRVVLQCLMRSGGILSLPGALPVAKMSMTLLSSSMVGSTSSSSMIGMHLIAPRAEGVTVFSLE